MPTRRAFLNSATAVLALSLAAPAIAESDGAIPVVATFSILGDMVERIGGEHVAVTTLVGPDGDTHVYQPTPADARAVSEATILVVNGLQFEGWLDRLIDAYGLRGYPRGGDRRHRADRVRRRARSRRCSLEVHPEEGEHDHDHMTMPRHEDHGHEA